MATSDSRWYRVNNGFINTPLLGYLENLFKCEHENGYNLKVAIGTDSQRNSKGYRFATVIVIIREENLGDGVVVGRGGMIVAKTYYSDKYRQTRGGVKERMLFEVSNSVEVAYEISPLLDTYDIPLEVHADINPNVKWESSKALSEAVGYILGMGYEFKIKPESFAASKVADKMTRT
tara:strand:+ start:688 stop:1218 length:531 start_codon:yes stop_codon:yes gene_type:complete